MKIFQEIVRSLRNLRAEAHVAPQQWLNKSVIRIHENSEALKIIRESKNQISNLCRIHDVLIENPESEWSHGASLSSVTGDCEIKLPVGDFLDVEKEIARLKNEIATIEKNIASSQAKLNKQSFIERAPADVVEKEKLRVSDGINQVTRLKANLESLSK